MDFAYLSKLHKWLNIHLLSGFKFIVDVVAGSAWWYLKAILGLDLEQGQDGIKVVVLDDHAVQFEFGHDLSNVLPFEGLQFHLNLKALAVFVLDMLRSSDALEISFDHNAQSRRQGFSFFHRVGSEDDSCVFLLCCYSWDDPPHESSRLRVHSSRRLIEEDNARVSDHCHRNW